MRALILALLMTAVSISCSTGPAVVIFYVVVKPTEAARFVTAITAIAKEDGFETAVAQTTFDDGSVLKVVEGRGHGLKLWVQSAPLSGREDPHLCGEHSGPYPDPAQFIVATQPRFFGSRAAAVELGGRVFSQLKKLDFDVRWQQPVCGAAVLRETS